MQKFTEEQIIKITETAINNIKKGNNPYKNLKFVDDIFEGYENHNIVKSVKSILKENFEGKINENLFIGEQLSTPQHLYNYLYEQNLLSKYTEIAEYMNYPPITQLKKKITEEQGEFEDEGQQWETFLQFIAKDVLKTQNISHSISYLYPKNLKVLPDKTVPHTDENGLHNVYYIIVERENHKEVGKILLQIDKYRKYHSVKIDLYGISVQQSIQ